MFELVIWCRLFINLLVLVYKCDHMPLLPNLAKFLHSVKNCQKL